jgi:hypothetical protein
MAASPGMGGGSRRRERTGPDVAEAGESHTADPTSRPRMHSLARSLTRETCADKQTPRRIGMMVSNAVYTPR